jgi:hypothetical protein
MRCVISFTAKTADEHAGFAFKVPLPERGLAIPALFVAADF